MSSWWIDDFIIAQYLFLCLVIFFFLKSVLSDINVATWFPLIDVYMTYLFLFFYFHLVYTVIFEVSLLIAYGQHIVWSWGEGRMLHYFWVGVGVLASHVISTDNTKDWGRVGYWLVGVKVPASHLAFPHTSGGVLGWLITALTEWKSRLFTWLVLVWVWMGP